MTGPVSRGRAGQSGQEQDRARQHQPGPAGTGAGISKPEPGRDPQMATGLKLMTQALRAFKPLKPDMKHRPHLALPVLPPRGGLPKQTRKPTPKRKPAVKKKAARRKR